MEIQHGENDNNKRMASKGVLWCVVLTILSLWILSSGFYDLGNSNDNIIFFISHNDISHLVGYYLPISLIIWIIYYLCFIRKKGLVIALISYAIIHTSFIVPSYISGIKQFNDIVNTVRSMENKIDEAIDLSFENQSSPEKVTSQKQLHASTASNPGKFENYINAYMDRAITLRKNYISELNQIGWNTILDTNRINQDTTLRESEKIIENAKTIVLKYRKLSDELLINPQKEVNKVPLEGSIKESFLSGVKKGHDPGKKYLDKHWDLEEKAILEFENIVKLLKATKGAWKIIDGKIYFANSDDLNKFNAFIFSIHSITEEQLTMQKETLLKGKKKFRRLLDNQE